jgi:hypothetical protein
VKGLLCQKAFVSFLHNKMNYAGTMNVSWYILEMGQIRLFMELGAATLFEL